MSSTTHTPRHHHSTATSPSRSGDGAALGRFAVHYFEMVLAMVAGMVILGPLESLSLEAAGRSSVLDNSGVTAMVMATNMTVAMAAWMRFRGHGRAPILEMSAAMYLPFLVLLVPLWREGISQQTFVLGGHVLMLLGMLAAMLLRPQEYTGHHSH